MAQVVNVEINTGHTVVMVCTCGKQVLAKFHTHKWRVAELNAAVADWWVPNLRYDDEVGGNGVLAQSNGQCQL